MNCQTPPSNQLLHPPCLSNLNWEQHLDAFMANTLNSHSSHFMPFPTDAGFVQRAARYSSFSYSNYGAFSEISESEKPTRAASSHCLKVKESGGAQLEVGDAEFGSGREDSSVTDPASAHEETNAKKRKAAPKRKQKAAEESDFSAKKSRSTEAVGTEKGCAAPKEEQSADEKIGKDDVAKAAEPFKDYIHVRARRGQATDSHSLAERVRREKISQRMKLLQDLVPGCNKITGKALMLDEIINYVQSLQRQVEFLSMKLATVNPGLDFNLESLISKESLLNQANASFPNSFYPSENTSASINYVHQSNKEINPLPFTVANGMGSIGQLDSILHQASMMQSSLDMFGISASQVENLWDDELHNVLQTGFHGQLSLGHMKMEP